MGYTRRKRNKQSRKRGGSTSKYYNESRNKNEEKLKKLNRRRIEIIRTLDMIFNQGTSSYNYPKLYNELQTIIYQIRKLKQKGKSNINNTTHKRINDISNQNLNRISFSYQ